MKYALIFAHMPDRNTVPQERQDEVNSQTLAWFGEHGAAGRIVNYGAHLQPVSTATTVKAPTDGGDKPVVVDGPFSEAKEVIAGFSVIDVPDLDAAIELARSWPPLQFPGDSVEIRPIFEYEGM
jgi:hypothetical protein